MLGGLSALAQISLFFASLVVLYMIFKVLERMLANKKNGNGNKSGDRSVEEWEGRMRRLNQESEKSLMEAMKDKVTDPIVREIRGLREDLKQRPIH